MICNLFIDVITHLGDGLTRVINHKGWSSKYVRSLFMVKLVVYIYLYLYLYIYRYIYLSISIYNMCICISIYIHIYILILYIYIYAHGYPIISQRIHFLWLNPLMAPSARRHGPRSSQPSEVRDPRPSVSECRAMTCEWWLWPYHTNMEKTIGKP